MIDQRRYQEAEALLPRALSLDPGDARAHYNLGVLFRDSGRVKQAGEEFRHARRADPEYVPAQVSLAALPRKK